MEHHYWGGGVGSSSGQIFIVSVMDSHPVIRGSLDILSVFVVLGTLTDYLPSIAAGLSIAWYIYSFYRVWKDGRNAKYKDFE